MCCIRIWLALPLLALLAGTGTPSSPRSQDADDRPPKQVDVVDERSGDGGFSIFAISKVEFPVTMTLDFPTLDNMKSSVKTPLTVVVQPKKRMLVARLSRVDRRRSARYSTQWSTMFGWRSEKEVDYAYTLPFAAGETFTVGQGFGGEFSHQGKNAIDFTMPEGTTVCAARDGVVIDVVTKYSEGGLTEDMKTKGNRILILHDDGTVSRYAHLKQFGAVVKVGQKVKAGQEIGQSGQTGYAKGPHLHFELNRPPAEGGNDYESLKFEFIVADSSGGTKRVEPKQGNRLTRPAN